jgi:hypothetical protein
MVAAKYNDAYSTMLGAREKEIGPKGVDVAVSDDDEERHVPSKRVLGTFGRIGEDGLELGKLDEHAEERAGHCLRRQDQHLAPVPA